MHKPINPPRISTSQIQSVKAAYQKLVGTFLETNPHNKFHGYIQSSIASEATLDRHIRAFEIYAPYLAPNMQVLDWGCRHAPDSCMMKTLHPDIQLYGCDFANDDFSEFFDYSKLSFKTIEHEFKLPYENGSFDAVLSSGVLEHVGFEQESVREIWRVLKEGGWFFVTFLPNKTSLTENASRMIGSTGCHNRLYDLDHTRNMFLRSGFVIEKCGYHQVFPTFGKNIKANKALYTVANVGAKLNRFAEKVPVVNAISANLFFVLRRVRHM